MFIFVQHREHWGRPMARMIMDLDSKGKGSKRQVGRCRGVAEQKPDGLKTHLPKVRCRELREHQPELRRREERDRRTGASTRMHTVPWSSRKRAKSWRPSLDSVNETDTKKVVEALKKVK